MELLRRELEILAVFVAIVAVVRFEWFCLDDVLHAPYVRTLPREAWLVLCLVLIPIGGIFYLYYGRPRR